MSSESVSNSKQSHTVKAAVESHAQRDEKSGCMAAYIGLAIGDALGATVEFMTASEIKHEYGEHRDITGGGWLKLKPGNVTDDTSMSFAMGNTIIDNQRINPYDIAHSFSLWMKSKPVDIGNTVRRGIQNFRVTNDPEAPASEYAAGNGACMRCLPIAIASLGMSRSYVIRANIHQAHITHSNKLSDAGTQCVIDMIQMALRGETLADLFAGPVADLVNIHPEFDFRNKVVTNPSGYIVETLQAVFQALSATSSFEECIVNVVNRGGDADTTGAIAGMIAGSVYGLNEIPARWLESLDPDVLQECKRQANSLYELRDNIHISDSNPLI